MRRTSRCEINELRKVQGNKVRCDECNFKREKGDEGQIKERSSQGMERLVFW